MLRLVFGASRVNCARVSRVEERENNRSHERANSQKAIRRPTTPLLSHLNAGERWRVVKRLAHIWGLSDSDALASS